jgi:hypothetical protein
MVMKILDRIRSIFRQKKEEIRYPACHECGCATVPSSSDHTVIIGGGEDAARGERTEPVVRATVVICLPVYQCPRPECGTTMYGKEAQQLMEKCLSSLQENAKKI